MYFFDIFQLYAGVCVRIWTLRSCSTQIKRWNSEKKILHF